jgi:pimeloyl-ACP methyl ester carboxylesterase
VADTSARPLVLLHAFPLSSTMFDEQHRLLGDECRLITPDLRGFGAAPLPNDEPSIDAYADDVVAELDRRGIDQAVVGGVSIGGYITMSLLRRHPERVAALVLADTKATADTAEAAANRHRIADQVIADDSVQVLVDELVPRLVGSTTHQQRPEVLARVTDVVLSASPVAVAWAQRAMAARPDSRDVLAHASGPALMLVGAEDEVTPTADARAMVEGTPDAQLVILPGAGHLSPLETPEAFATAVRIFLQELSPRGR